MTEKEPPKEDKPKGLEYLKELAKFDYVKHTPEHKKPKEKN